MWLVYASTYTNIGSKFEYTSSFKRERRLSRSSRESLRWRCHTEEETGDVGDELRATRVHAQEERMSVCVCVRAGNVNMRAHTQRGRAAAERRRESERVDASPQAIRPRSESDDFIQPKTPRLQGGALEKVKARLTGGVCCSESKRLWEFNVKHKRVCRTGRKELYPSGSTLYCLLCVPVELTYMDQM